MTSILKKLFLFLILPSLAFWLGMLAQAWIYEDRCMDLGGGRYGNLPAEVRAVGSVDNQRLRRLLRRKTAEAV